VAGSADEPYVSFHCAVKEPLVPTLMQRVYANRFEGGGKTIFTMHNGQGHTVDGPIIAVARLRGIGASDSFGNWVFRHSSFTPSPRTSQSQK